LNIVYGWMITAMMACTPDGAEDGRGGSLPGALASDAPQGESAPVAARVFDYRVNGKTIRLPVGTQFTVELAAPRGGSPNERYEWTAPKVWGAVTHLATETRHEGDRQYWTYTLRTVDQAAGKLRIDRYYSAGSSDPAPDFGLRVQVTNPSINEESDRIIEGLEK
jgi:hypothetical protein